MSLYLPYFSKRPRNLHAAFSDRPHGIDEKMTMTNCQSSQKAIKGNTNSKQRNTDLSKYRGGSGALEE